MGVIKWEAPSKEELAEREAAAKPAVPKSTKKTATKKGD
jgi:hypothetical protein